MPNVKTIYKILFALTYSFVVLPFSTHFFRHIATPPTTESLFGIVSLYAAHNIFLPLYLAVIEFLSINVACMIWAKTSSGRGKVILVLLFLTLQALPMLSVYYDVNAEEYRRLSEAAERAISETHEALKDRRESIKTVIDDLTNEIAAIRSANNENNEAIGGLLLNDSENQSDGSEILDEIRNRRRLRDRGEREKRILLRQKTALMSDLTKFEDDSMAVTSQKRAKYDSELDYLTEAFSTVKGILPLFVSILFPVGILAFARILTKDEMGGHYTGLINIDEHVRSAASLPPDMHYSVVKAMAPALAAHFSGAAAAANILDKNDTLHHEHKRCLDLIEEKKSVQAKIAASKLTEEAKSYLCNQVEAIITNSFKE